MCTEDIAPHRRWSLFAREIVGIRGGYQGYWQSFYSSACLAQYIHRDGETRLIDAPRIA